ncbi:DUF805 domain-containing protein [Dinoroseobacter sp. PD6]|uniref:DUF805 domain-containing protein n=1 Tax=Dinoroseobacter sp. PD6 TaxID=3028384 RepID=UPI00237AD89B|nr:DUF805 domain-containing protein [Dinoroseobacter sp. PD6]MDD9716727.1 DUF805 domain-containing protein [Dinoroseobacter sp. PD6]
MGFLRAIASAFVNVVNFGGRATRAEFWYFQLFIYALTIGGVLFVIFALQPEQIARLGAATDDNPWYFGVSVFLWIQSWSLLVRRLHDTDRSGFWSLIGFVPIIGLLVLLVFAVQPGDRGNNRFGPPRGGARPARSRFARPDVTPGKTEEDRKAEVRALYQARVKCLTN